MTTNQKVLIGVVLALVAFTSAFLGGRVAGGSSLLGGSINAYQAGVWQFGNGIYAGLSQQLSIDNAGALSTSGGISNTGTLTQGSSGTALTQINGGFCDLNFGTTTSAIAASSTVAVDCQGTNMLASATATQSALLGVSAWSASSPQRVRVQLASSTPAIGMSAWLDGCTASTTAGYITCRLTNGTGASLTPATTTTHWAQYWVDK